MAKDISVTGFEDKPGVSASLGEALGNAGINITGLFGSGKLGEIHVLVEDDDVAAARRAIEGVGLRVGDARDAIIIPDTDRPGGFGGAARRLADAGVNIDHHYVASNTRLVFVVDDIEKARAAVG